MPEPQNRNAEISNEGMPNYNEKEVILLLRSIERLLGDNNRILLENNELMKNANDKLRSISFNTKD